MPPPLIGGGIKRWCCLTSVCLASVYLTLSVAYIGPKSRTERPRKTKIGTEVAHVTRDSDTHSQGQKVKGQGHQATLLTAALTCEAGAAVAMRTYLAWELLQHCVCSAAREAFGGGEGRGHIVSPRAQLVRWKICSGIVFWKACQKYWHHSNVT